MNEWTNKDYLVIVNRNSKWKEKCYFRNEVFFWVSSPQPLAHHFIPWEDFYFNSQPCTYITFPKKTAVPIYFSGIIKVLSFLEIAVYENYLEKCGSW